MVEALRCLVLADRAQRAMVLLMREGSDRMVLRETVNQNRVIAMSDGRSERDRRLLGDEEMESRVRDVLGDFLREDEPEILRGREEHAGHVLTGKE